jgi:transcriptional regulator
MYIPPHYRNSNHNDLLAFMKAHPFALLTSNGAKIPLATHLPFIVKEAGEKLILSSHFSAGNPHAHSLTNGADALVIFSGPHAYISPSLYEKKENVPTWNYIAVHASGTFRRDDSEESKEEVLKQMIGLFEPSYLEQYDSLNRDYISKMIKGIVAFDIEVLNLEGKFKLSQNKTMNERKRIEESLSGNELAEWMKHTRPE